MFRRLHRAKRKGAPAGACTRPASLSWEFVSGNCSFRLWLFLFRSGRSAAKFCPRAQLLRAVFFCAIEAAFFANLLEKFQCWTCQFQFAFLFFCHLTPQTVPATPLLSLPVRARTYLAPFPPLPMPATPTRVYILCQ